MHTQVKLVNTKQQLRTRWNIIIPGLIVLLVTITSPAATWNAFFTYVNTDNELRELLDEGKIRAIPDLLIHLSSLWSGCIGLCIISTYYLVLFSVKLKIKLICWFGLLSGFGLLLWVFVVGGAVFLPYQSYVTLGQLEIDFASRVPTVNWLNIMRGYIVVMNLTLTFCVANSPMQSESNFGIKDEEDPSDGNHESSSEKK